ncbi:MAG: signal recognition particle-docking protein FtsY [Candidatus Aureabacteria bacterium]|nr:signal recognition particle-docking protein FtsY [Candidatus Auribacterota bacterium]
MHTFTKNIYERIKKGLKKTHDKITKNIGKILPTSTDWEENLEQIEEALIESDLGVDLSMNVLEKLRSQLNLLKEINNDDVFNKMGNILKKHLLNSSRELKEKDSLVVVIFIGINGTGKTTTLAKTALNLLNSNKKVMLAACDTFRAAAIEQISLWGEKLNVNVIKGNYGSDAASIAFDAIDSAKAKNMDYLLIDTAGRLHNSKELMEELKKIIRICNNKIPVDNLEKLFILDGTTGQNGFHQAKAFSESVGINGIVVTKLDGTAKGGIVIAIEDQLQIPVKYIGVGEEMEDLIPFNPDYFIDAMLK